MYDQLKPLLFLLNPETAHHVSASVGAQASNLPGAKILFDVLFQFEDERLVTSLAGMNLSNPIGVAAGFDKNGYLLKLFSLLGFGFMEVGSITSRPSSGNPKPRMFRLPHDEAIINRLGLNNEGAEKIAQRLKHLDRDSLLPFGVNVAKTNDPSLTGDAAVSDFIHGYEAVKKLGRFHVLNISCPNTEDGKTFEEPESLTALLKAMNSTRGELPLFVKCSPDIDESLFKEVIDIFHQQKISGVVLSNTTNLRENLRTDGFTVSNYGRGGLSGKPLYDRLLARVKVAKPLLKDLPIIAVGGVDTGKKVFELLQAGATATEMYTGIVYRGAAVAKQVKQELLFELNQNNINSVKDISHAA